MNQRRLPWLLATMFFLGLLRWWVPPTNGTSDSLAEPSQHAVERLRSQAAAAPGSLSPGESPPPSVQLVRQLLESMTAHQIVISEARSNAFAVRPSAPAVAPMAAMPAPMPVAPLPLPPPPPPTALMSQPVAPQVQVIGTWDDPSAPGVFVQTTSGTRLVRTGDVLDDIYRVSSIDAGQILLSHASVAGEWRIQIPRGRAN